MRSLQNEPPSYSHLFLDEAGDLTFFGKGRLPIVGIEGVSNYFILGMVYFDCPLNMVRNEVLALQKQIVNDVWYKDIRSIQRKLKDKGYYFHATDDLPEARKLFYEWIKQAPVQFEAVIALKDPERFVHKHNSKELAMYTDLLSHLLKDKLYPGGHYSLCVAQIGNIIKSGHLQTAIKRAIKLRVADIEENDEIKTDYFFRNQLTEPLLNVADYFCWAIQRVLEKKESRFYNYIQTKVMNLQLLWDNETWEDKVSKCKEHK